MTIEKELAEAISWVLVAVAIAILALGVWVWGGAVGYRDGRQSAVQCMQKVNDAKWCVGKRGDDDE